jgi:hypothetical protein
MSESSTEYPNFYKIFIDTVGNPNELLSRCPNLAKLTIGSYVDGNLTECQNVTELILKNCSLETLSFLASLPRLQRVTFIRCRPSPEDIEYWSSRVTLVVNKGYFPWL